MEIESTATAGSMATFERGPTCQHAAAARPPLRWEELPSDLLGLVLHLLPSLADRVHLRTICHPWRMGAQPQRHKPLPLLLPWLALIDGTLVDLHGTPVRCAPILHEGIFCYLSVDNLAFLMHGDGGCSLMNPLSSLTLHLPKLAPAVSRALENLAYDQSYVRKTHTKVILSLPLDLTPDPLVAIIIKDGFSLAISPSKDYDAISISLPLERPGGLPTMMISDISFFHGELYALTVYEGFTSSTSMSMASASQISFISASRTTPSNTKYTVPTISGSSKYTLKELGVIQNTW
ncbi:uncharacterized protein [Setaria viridis]|uniref:uncharacterized protein n=1 Tax=Setaria viridis TaxID=4556 RepID=UPI003B3B5911